MTETISVAQTDIKTRNFVHTLRGTRTSNITSVTVNGETDILEPAGWRIVLTLVAGENEFEVRGFVNAGLVKQINVTITVLVYEQELLNTWNVLDEWGLELGTPRLLGESNRGYNQRLTDASLFPGGAWMVDS